MENTYFINGYRISRGEYCFYQWKFDCLEKRRLKIIKKEEKHTEGGLLEKVKIWKKIKIKETDAGRDMQKRIKVQYMRGRNEE